jgi:hypothetical protein
LHLARGEREKKNVANENEATVKSREISGEKLIQKEVRTKKKYEIKTKIGTRVVG